MLKKLFIFAYMMQEKISYYMRISLGFIILILLLNACSPARHVPQGEKLLANTNINSDNTSIESEELESTMKQKPNRRMFGFFRFHLTMYNMIHPLKEKENWRSKIANIIGEPPVIYDSTLIQKSASTLKYLLNYKGFYNAEVNTIIKHKERSVKVTYEVKTGKPIIINEINFDILDPNIYDILVEDSINSLLNVGNNLDIDVLEDERTRLIRVMKSKGYYDFSINNIHFYADTNTNKLEAKLSIAIRKSFDAETVHENTPFTKYKIKEIFVFTHFNPVQNLALGDQYINNILSEEIIDGYHFKYLNKHQIKPAIFFQSNFIKPGDYYNIDNVERTRRHLSSLKQFRLISINMVEDTLVKNAQDKFLNCYIYLTPLKKQSYTIELEGTNTSGNFGGGSAITYNNRNLFKGAENLSVKGALSLQTMRDTREIDKRFLNTLETSGEVKLYLPKLWPVNLFDKNVDFIKNHNPKTQVSISTSYLKRPDFARLLNNANIGYHFTSGKRSQYTHTFSPMEFYQVKLTDTIDGFSDNFNEYIKKSYEDQFISVISYDFIYSGQNINKLKSFAYLWYNIESAGNILEGIYELSNAEPIDGSFRVFGLDFSQFIKTDIDFRYYTVFNKSHSLVYRGYFGIGIPYGNSKDSGLPFIKKYFTGGANDIRAFQVRMVGPGAYSSESILNNVADMKLLFNIEYRFDIMKYLEGALFVDAGNIWNIGKKSEQPGTDFAFNRFYKEMAIGTGLGIRFDITFIILRFDFGIPLYDPSLPEHDRWLKTFSPLQWNDLTFNFGIGYPF
jgi:outer membrane protein assembly factor BamA